MNLNLYIKKVIEELNNGHEVLIPLKGFSMEPTFFENDILHVKQQSAYATGDIIVFKYRDEGILVHRIVECRQYFILCKGDNAHRIEVVLHRQVLGKVVGYDRRVNDV